MTVRHAANSIIGTWRSGALSASAALLALLCAAPAQAFMISVNESIIWQTPSFGDSMFTGDSMFESGKFNRDNNFVSDGSFGAHRYSAAPVDPSHPIDLNDPPNPILPGDAIIWQFGGTLAAADGSVFPADAFAPGTVDPPPRIEAGGVDN